MNKLINNDSAKSNTTSRNTLYLSIDFIALLVGVGTIITLFLAALDGLINHKKVEHVTFLLNIESRRDPN